MIPHSQDVAHPRDFTEPAIVRPVSAYSTIALVGRILMSGIFLVSGFAKLVDPSGTIAHMTAAGIPSPELLVWIAAAAEILGGAALVLGFLPRLAALGLALFLIPTTYYFHAFWNLAGSEQVMQMANFMKNLSIMGGLLMVVAFGGGRYRVRGRRNRRSSLAESDPIVP